MILYLLGPPTFRNVYSPNSVCLPSLTGADLALELGLLSPCTLHWLQYQAPPVGPGFLPQVPSRWHLWSELELLFHGVHYGGGGACLVQDLLTHFVDMIQVVATSLPPRLLDGH